MNKNSILFLLPCSNNKNIGGIHKYSSSNSILSDISKEKASYILERRENSYQIIKTHQIQRTGQRISDLTFNKHLRNGKDISINGTDSDELLYMPAFNRYNGRIYSSLGEDRLHIANQTESNILIISGLYGILKPEELIQLYSLNVSDSLEIRSNWVRKDVITDSLSDYIEKYRIKHIINFISVRNYSLLINWSKLRSENNLTIYHPFSKQFAGDQFHPTLGKYLAFFLKMNEDEIVSLFRQEIIKIENQIDLHLLQTSIPDDKTLAIEINKYDTIDRILRMAFNIREIIEYLGIIRADGDSDADTLRKFFIKYKNDNLDTRLFDDFYAKRNSSIHEMKDLTEEEWIAARDAYIDFVSWCEVNIKPINHFILHPVD